MTPPPLPSNAESAVVCEVNGGLLVAASERAGAFTPKQQRYVELVCKLIDSA